MIRANASFGRPLWATTALAFTLALNSKPASKTRHLPIRSAAKRPLRKEFTPPDTRIIHPFHATHKSANSIQNMANLAFPLLL